MNKNPKLSRRSIVKAMGLGGAALAGLNLAGAQAEVPAPDTKAKLTIFNFGGEAHPWMKHQV